LQWFDLAGDGTGALKAEGAVSFAVREMPHEGYVVTQIAVPTERAAGALQVSYALAAEGSKTWSIFGANCATTSLNAVYVFGDAGLVRGIDGGRRCAREGATKSENRSDLD
jgi:hypothetical protein